MSIPRFTKVLITDETWRRLLGELRRHPGGVERVAYLDGYLVDLTGYPTDDRLAVVTTIVLPDAHLTPGNYTVSAAAMSRAGAHLRERRMTRLVQVHTHGDDWVEHSPTDDQRAFSQRPGALSIVLPHHADGAPTLNDCGVHVRTRTGWQRLNGQDLAEHVEILTYVHDHRDPSCLTTPTTPRPTTPAAESPTGIFSRLAAWISHRLRRR